MADAQQLALRHRLKLAEIEQKGAPSKAEIGVNAGIAERSVDEARLGKGDHTRLYCAGFSLASRAFAEGSSRKWTENRLWSPTMPRKGAAPTAPRGCIRPDGSRVTRI